MNGPTSLVVSRRRCPAGLGRPAAFRVQPRGRHRYSAVPAAVETMPRANRTQPSRPPGCGPPAEAARRAAPHLLHRLPAGTLADEPRAPSSSPGARRPSACRRAGRGPCPHVRISHTLPNPEHLPYFV